MEDAFEKLQEAKEAVIWLVRRPAGALVNFHDLVYWATEVERLRKEIAGRL